jgi:hypothetical protein
VQAGGKKRTSLSWPGRGNAARQASCPSLPPAPSLPLPLQSKSKFVQSGIPSISTTGKECHLFFPACAHTHKNIYRTM